MRFDENVQLDASQVEDVRGRGGFGGGGRRGGTTMPIAVGGGGAGLLLILLIVGLQMLGGGVDTGTVPAAPAYEGQAQDASTVTQSCRTGADANQRDDCRIVGFVNSIQSYWSGELSRQGARYTPADTVLFSNATQSACGTADAAAGPFYCPLDQKVYLDLAFFDELKARFGAHGGPFAEAYVVAHEYGHHVQDLRDELGSGRGQGAQSGSVRTELQADCLAGVWAANAVKTGFIVNLTQQDIDEGLDAAAAVGDDRIQRSTQGRVTPETWTHGSAAQRQRWFNQGYQQGDLKVCDTSQGAV